MNKGKSLQTSIREKVWVIQKHYITEYQENQKSKLKPCIRKDSISEERMKS